MGMFKRQYLSPSEDFFKYIDNYRNSLNKDKATADVMFYLALEVLIFGSSIGNHQGREDGIEKMLKQKAQKVSVSLTSFTAKSVTYIHSSTLKRRNL